MNHDRRLKRLEEAAPAVEPFDPFGHMSEEELQHVLVNLGIGVRGRLRADYETSRYENGQLVDVPGPLQTDIEQAAHWIGVAWEEFGYGPDFLADLCGFGAWPTVVELAAHWPGIEAAHGRTALCEASGLTDQQLANLLDQGLLIIPLQAALEREPTKNDPGSAHYMLWPDRAGEQPMTLSGRWQYQIERQAHRQWAVRNTTTGRIVGYPGPDYLSVARSWLKWECGEDGQTAETLAAFGEVIDQAAARLATEIERYGRAWEEEQGE